MFITKTMQLKWILLQAKRMKITGNLGLNICYYHVQYRAWARVSNGGQQNLEKWNIILNVLNNVNQWSQTRAEILKPVAAAAFLCGRCAA